ncbi:hypothetical protein SLEP1_g43557 [Rubroshorea leprosula]|uniref:Uncharacterized protein n=1 Tax=Rubroshorea leprosula TaxID=152421 RepID=A0AAV5LDA8_9ROSI|nr:hypothetical protein SLEP1_g43557 [Rubroshorea leprosula]
MAINGSHIEEGRDFVGETGCMLQGKDGIQASKGALVEFGNKGLKETGRDGNKVESIWR